MPSPTQRSLKKLRDDGYLVHVAERWNPWAKVRQDAFGFVDLVALKAGEPPLLVQVTSGSHASERMEKIRGLPSFEVVRKALVKIQVHAWRKAGPRGGRKKWEVRIEEM